MSHIRVVEHQVPDLDVGAFDARHRLRLLVRVVRYVHPDRLPGGQGEAGAVVRGRTGGAENVRLARLAAGERGRLVALGGQVLRRAGPRAVLRVEAGVAVRLGPQRVQVGDLRVDHAALRGEVGVLFGQL